MRDLEITRYECAGCGDRVPREGDERHGPVQFHRHPSVEGAQTFTLRCRAPKVEIRRQLQVMGVPPHLHEGLVAYLTERREPGSFLRAVLENDLQAAVTRADWLTVSNLHPLVMFLVNQATAACWGSPAAVAAWLAAPAPARFTVEPYAHEEA